MKKSIYTLILSLLFIIHINAQTWNVVPSGTTKRLNAISFPSPTVGYIAGDDSLLLKSTDGGLTWNQLDMSNFIFSSNIDDFNDVEFVSNTIGYIMVGPYGGTYKTIDGGITWTNVTLMCFNTSLYMIDENNGFQGGSGCFSGDNISKQTIGFWDTTNINQFNYTTYGTIDDFDFWSDSIGMAASSSNYFFRATDGGFVWDTIHSTLGNADQLTSVLFMDSLKVVATFIPDAYSGGGSGIIKSNDGGLTWVVHALGGAFVYPNLKASLKAENGDVFLGGQVANDQLGVIYTSQNQMVSWSNTFVQEGINDLGSHSNDIVFAVGENGYIIVNQPLPGLVLNEEIIDDNIQVYPNPSNGNLHISTNYSSINAIEIFDIRGARINTNVFSQNSSKEYTIEGLNSGVYIVKVRIENQWFSKRISIF